jgi:hypothetical protein
MAVMSLSDDLEGSAADRLAGDDAEEHLDQVNLARRRQPSQHLQRFRNRLGPQRHRHSSLRPNTKAPLAMTLKLNEYSTAQFGKCQELPV